jgi:hypothetical protein
MDKEGRLTRRAEREVSPFVYAETSRSARRVSRPSLSMLKSPGPS